MGTDSDSVVLSRASPHCPQRSEEPLTKVPRPESQSLNRYFPDASSQAKVGRARLSAKIKSDGHSLAAGTFFNGSPVRQRRRLV